MSDFRRIGSTDVCCKAACLASRYYGDAVCVCEPEADVFFREVTPDELAANEKFAAEFMGRAIPGITCSEEAFYVDLAKKAGTEVVLTQPYRTFIITSIAPPPEEWCKCGYVKDHEGKCANYAKQPIKNDRDWF